MATAAQTEANRANAQLSTGPTSPEGKATISKNNFQHGLTGKFQVFGGENQAAYDDLLAQLTQQHEPRNGFEVMLIANMAQHFWLARRAMLLQEVCFEVDIEDFEKRMALYLRYQTTHERAFHKCADELRKLRNEKRKEQIGFESQKLKQAAEERKQSVEKRKQDLHHCGVLLAQAKIDHQKMLTRVAGHPMRMEEIAENERATAQKAA